MPIVRWKPFGDIDEWTNEVERRMKKMFDPEENRPVLVPRVDIKETKNELVVSVEIPGMEKKDINVAMKEGVLTVSGEKKSEARNENESWHRIERVYGAFQRSFYIPLDVDETKIKAAYKDGVLNVTLPKKEEAKPKEIPISVE